jgi:hypothetical protein
MLASLNYCERLLIFEFLSEVENAMRKNIVTLIMVPVLLFCSCKDREQADLEAGSFAKRMKMLIE